MPKNIIISYGKFKYSVNQNFLVRLYLFLCIINSERDFFSDGRIGAVCLFHQSGLFIRNSKLPNRYGSVGTSGIDFNIYVFKFCDIQTSYRHIYVSSYFIPLVQFKQDKIILHSRYPPLVQGCHYIRGILHYPEQIICRIRHLFLCL